MDQGEVGIEKAKTMIDMMVELGYNEVMMNAFGWDTSWANGYSTDPNDNHKGFDFGPTQDFPWKTFDGFVFTDENYIYENKNKIDFSQMNESYWAKVDEVLQYMTEKGITAHIFWKVYNKEVMWANNANRGASYYNNNPYVDFEDTMYARFFRDRYGAYNVIFDMGKESYNLGGVANASSRYPNGIPQGEGNAFYLDAITREFRDGNGHDRLITTHDYETYMQYLKDGKGSDENYSINGDYTDMAEIFVDQGHNKNGVGPSYSYTLGYKNKFPLIPFYQSETNYQHSNYVPHYNTYGASNDEKTPEAAIRDYAEITIAGGYWAHYYTLHAWDVVKYNEKPEQHEYFTNLVNFINDNVGVATWQQMTPQALNDTENTRAITDIKEQNGSAKVATSIPGKNYLVYVGYGVDDKNVTRPDYLNSVTINFTNVDSTKPLTGYWFNILTGETIKLENVISTNGEVTFEYPTFKQAEDKHGSGDSAFLYFVAPDEAASGNIKAIDTIDDISVKYVTSLSDLEKLLPTSIVVTDENNIKAIVNIDWDTTNYNGSPANNASETYTLSGTLTDLPNGLTNGNNLKATINVIVREFVQEYNVVFKNGDTIVNNITVEKGQLVTNPADPIKIGHVFEHWYITDETLPYNFSTPITNNLTLNATFRALNKTNVNVEVLLPDNTPAIGAVVSLEDIVSLDIIKIGTLSNVVGNSGIVTFADVAEGNHKITIEMDNKTTVVRNIVIEENTKDNVELIVYVVPSIIEPGLTRNYYKDVTDLNFSQLTSIETAQNVKEEINFNWGTTEPIIGVNDNFGVQYTGLIYIPKDGEYKFRIEANDDYELTIGDNHYIDKVLGADVAKETHTVTLTQGYHKFDYKVREISGTCQMKIWWTVPGEIETIIPSSAYFSGSSASKIITYAEALASKSLPVGTPFQDASIHQGAYEVIFSDGTTGNANVIWDQVGYGQNNNIAGEYVTTGTLSGTDIENPGDIKASIKITFIEDEINPEQTAVDEAKVNLQDAQYSLTQQEHNTTDTAKVAILAQVNKLLENTGITTVINQTGFSAAQSGTASNKSGVNGNYNFTVTLTKGSSTATTAENSATIAATPYVENIDPDQLAVDTAKINLQDAQYSLTQQEHNTTDTAKVAILAKINTLLKDTGVTATINQTGFSAAQAGTASNKSGVNGSYNFTVTLTKGSANTTTLEDLVTIVATKYVGDSSSSGGFSSGGSNSGSSSDLNSSYTQDDELYVITKAPKATNNISSIELDISTKTSDGIASVLVSTSEITSALKNIVNKLLIPKLILDVDSSNSTELVELELQSEALEDLVDEPDGVLEVKTNFGIMTFDHEALNSLLKGANDSYITFRIGEVQNLNRSQYETLNDNVSFVIEILKDDEIITDFDGEIEVLFAYDLKENETSDTIAVYSIDNKGNVLLQDTLYSLSEEAISFVATDFSIYMVDSLKNPFEDIKSTDWYYGDVLRMHSKGYIPAITDNKFSPNDFLTRAEFANMLYLMHDAPKVIEIPLFKDIMNHKLFNAINWAATINIYQGYNDGMFRPNNNITIEEVIIVMYNYAKYCGLDLTNEENLLMYNNIIFSSNESQTAMKWAIANNLIIDNKINPQKTATRAEISSITSIFLDILND
ncbi:hypothetical protein AN641_09525 [Candidatus Epulonipiscioides gigas]|nr:hypothetical protein AN641_09525 [Epulopiscium sp. SCG-C07WGA-EpuloA2]